ncbi:E3 ubiquitin-protein ligase march6, partial [Thalictrum thalictroides]
MEFAVEPSNSTDDERINTNSIESVGTSSSSSNNNIEISGKYEEEDDEDVCRICRNTGDAENPLRYPCACSGSIKFVHQDCLLQWLNHSNARKCE